MPVQVNVEALRRSAVLGGLPEAELAQLVLAGQLKAVLPSEGGEEAVLSVMGSGETFGEIALLDGGPRSATIVALEPVQTATLGRADFLNLLRRSPAALEGVLAGLTRVVRRLTDEVGNLMGLDVAGRLAKKLLALAATHGKPANGATEIDVALTQEDLAGMIGATRASVNKLLGIYEGQGAIARSGRRITVLRPELLEQRITY